MQFIAIARGYMVVPRGTSLKKRLMSFSHIGEPMAHQSRKCLRKTIGLMMTGTPYRVLPFAHMLTTLNSVAAFLMRRGTKNGTTYYVHSESSELITGRTMQLATPCCHSLLT